MKYLGVVGALLGLSLLGVPALADETKQPVPRVGQVVIESMGPASGTIPKGKLATIVNYIHADKHTWYKNGSRHSAKHPDNKGTQRNLHDRFVLKMRYGLGDGYDVRFAMGRGISASGRPRAARPTTAWAQALGARWRALAWGTPLTAGGSSSKARLCICIAG